MTCSTAHAIDSGAAAGSSPDDAVPDETARERRNDRAAQWERRLALPVILAAAVSAPAVFLTIFGSGRMALVGTLLNWASLAVLTAEAVVLFVLAGDRLAWVRRHRWTLAVTGVALPRRSCSCSRRCRCCG